MEDESLQYQQIKKLLHEAQLNINLHDDQVRALNHYLTELQMKIIEMKNIHQKIYLKLERKEQLKQNVFHFCDVKRLFEISQLKAEFHKHIFDLEAKHQSELHQIYLNNEMPLKNNGNIFCCQEINGIQNEIDAFKSKIHELKNKKELLSHQSFIEETRSVKLFDFEDFSQLCKYDWKIRDIRKKILKLKEAHDVNLAQGKNQLAQALSKLDQLDSHYASIIESKKSDLSSLYSLFLEKVDFENKKQKREMLYLIHRDQKVKEKIASLLTLIKQTRKSQSKQIKYLQDEHSNALKSFQQFQLSQEKLVCMFDQFESLLHLDNELDDRIRVLDYHRKANEYFKGEIAEMNFQIRMMN